jgi:hypothetical protein
MHLSISKVTVSRKARLNALEIMATEHEPKVNLSRLLQRMCVVPRAGYAPASLSVHMRSRGGERRQGLPGFVIFARTGPNPDVLRMLCVCVFLSQRPSLSIQENEVIAKHYRKAIGLTGSK